MSGDNSHNHQTTSVAGGTSATPTPANNVGGGTGWGDRLWMGGKEQGLGHVDVRHSNSEYHVKQNTLTTISSPKGTYRQINHGRVSWLKRPEVASREQVFPACGNG